MQITINEQNRILLNEALEELIVIKQELLELSLVVLIQLKNFFIQFIMSYKEYSLTNIKEHGLGEILTIRALRFFKLDIEEPKKTVEKKQRVNKTRSRAYYMKKSVKTILFPFYLLILVLDKIFHKKEEKTVHSKNIYVKRTTDYQSTE